VGHRSSAPHFFLLLTAQEPARRARRIELVIVQIQKLDQREPESVSAIGLGRGGRYGILTHKPGVRLEGNHGTKLNEIK
jgi:hypothetical protein